ncbi:MAG: DsrE family protein [Bacteroidales bacterium]|nr:DsrE family protein [Bacteroidales bacterium]
MAKIAIIVFSDTTSIEALGKVSNAFVLALEAIEHGDDLKIIFEGAGTKWIGELEKEDHKIHPLYKMVKSHITGACSYCAQAFGVKNQVEKAEIVLLDEFKNHPSLRNLIVDGYQIISF